MPPTAVACTLWVAFLIKSKNWIRSSYESFRGMSLSPPTSVDALYGLLFASFYYLYMQVLLSFRSCVCTRGHVATAHGLVCMLNINSACSQPRTPACELVCIQQCKQVCRMALESVCVCVSGMIHPYYCGTCQVIRNALEPLDCKVGNDGRSVMNADPSIICDKDLDDTYRCAHIHVVLQLYSRLEGCIDL